MVPGCKRVSACHRMTEVAIPTTTNLLSGASRDAEQEVSSLLSAMLADADIFGMITALCAAGLLISALLITEGLELGAELLRIF